MRMISIYSFCLLFTTLLIFTAGCAKAPEVVGQSESSEAAAVRVGQDTTAPQSPIIQVQGINPESVVQDDRGNMAANPLTLLPSFTDMAVMAGVSGAGIGDGSGFGEAVFGDYDRDGDLDLYVGNIEQPHVLYQNNGDGTFADVTSSAGVQNAGSIMDAGFLDYDNDGHLDLYVVNHARFSSAIYRNNGNGTFTALPNRVGVSATPDSHIALSADYDSDGYLDAYIITCPDKRGPNILYHNNGNGTAADVTNTAGVGDTGDGRDGAFLDYDNDGDMDLHVMNHINKPDALCRNNGDGTFTDVAMAAGLGEIRRRHGSTYGDYNNDGYLDIYIVAHNEPNMLYRSNADGTFTDVSAAAGVDHPGSGERAAFADYDNDGYLDLYVTNASISANILYRNNGDGTFSDVTLLSNASNVGKGGGVVSADYDGDGDLDFYLTNSDAPNVLYRNNGNSNNWLHMKLVSTMGNRNGIGARVKVVAGTLSQIRQVGGTAGRSGGAVLPITFGLGNYTQADRIEIRWPSGRMQTLTNVPANQVFTVMEEMQNTMSW